MLKDKS